LVALVKDSGDGDGPGPDKARAFAPVTEPMAGELAARFRPWLRFDSKERWRPLSIDSLFAEHLPNGRPAQRFCTRSDAGASCQPVGDSDEFEAAISEAGAQGAATYIDIAGKRVKEYRTPNRDCRKGRLLDCDDTSDSAIYYRVTSSNGRFYVDYWWFMRYNHFAGTSATCVVPTDLCGEHEGDWEGVTLVTSPDDPNTLDYVSYAAHVGTFRYPADQLERHGDRSEGEERPEVFIARGSHAAYPEKCSKLVCTQPIAIAGLIDTPEASTNGRSEWGRNDDRCEPGAPGSCLLPLPSVESGLTNWVTWAGLWGKTCGKRCQAKGPQAPESPGLQTRFLSPWCSTQDGASVCDTAAPGCSDWIGPVVAVLACNPRAIARGLQATEELPSGGLKMVVTSAKGEKLRISATTTGVVQALGEPLKKGSRVELTGAGAANEIHLRAQRGRNLLEARFEPFAGTSPEDKVTIQVGAREGQPTVLATVEGRAKPIQPQTRRARLVGNR
jgi:hypothetical protein